MNLISPSQYGFRKAHSSYRQIWTNETIILVWCFYWLEKSRDSVDHNTLPHKLEYSGFRGVISRWFSSYLQDRTKTTQICPHVSSRIDVTCGVTQGSALRPLFVLLWVYDGSSDKFNFYRFADEKNILYANKDLKSLELIVNQELRKLLVWLTAINWLNVKENKLCNLSPIQERLT